MDPEPRVMVRGLTSCHPARCCRLPKPPPACSCQRTGCAAAAAAPARVGACPGAPGRVDSTQPASIRPAAPFATNVAGDVAAGAAAADALDFVRRISLVPRRSANVAEQRRIACFCDVCVSGVALTRQAAVCGRGARAMELLACLALTIASHGRRMNGAGAWHRRAALRSSSTGEKAANGSRKKRSFKSNISL